MELKFQILYQFFLESNNEDDNFFLHTGKPKKNELHHNVNFSISYEKKILRINHILEWIRTRCLAVEYRLG